MIFTLRRRTATLVALAVALAAAAGAAWWWVNRPIRWLDAEHPPAPLAAAADLFARGDVDGGLSQFDRFLRGYRAPAWEPRARVMAAARLAAASRERAIAKVLPAPLDRSERLYPYGELYRARGLAAAGDAVRAVEAARSAASAPGFPERDEALRVQAAALESQGRAREAADLLERSGIATLRVEGARTMGRAGDAGGARRRLAELAVGLPPGDDAERALAELERVESEPARRLEGIPRPRVAAAALAWKEAGRAAPALELLRGTRAAAAVPGPEESLAEADALLRLGRPAEADAAAARAMHGSPESQAGALYLRAKASAALGRSGYRSGLEAAAHRVAAGRWPSAALWDLARLEEGPPSARTLAAYRHYREAARADADPLALWREGWAAYEIGNAAEADAAISRVLAWKEVPDSLRATALYWQARRLAERGRQDDARRAFKETAERYPAQYYGILAGRRAGLQPPSPMRTAPPPAVPDTAAARYWLAAARQLRTVGLADLASGAYRAAIGSASGSARAIGIEAALAALDGGSATEATQLLLAGAGDRDRLAASSVPLRLWQTLYPAPSGVEIADAAKAAGLDPALVASVVMEESAFNPLAVSRAGARGLLQLMPTTGAELARTLGIKGFTADSLFDPAVNLKIGAAYLRGLVAKHGSIPAALAAYNAGSARVERWADAATSRDDERFVERIPFGETRIYVKRILVDEHFYRLAWPGGLSAALR